VVGREGVQRSFEGLGLGDMYELLGADWEGVFQGCDEVADLFCFCRVKPKIHAWTPEAKARS